MCERKVNGCHDQVGIFATSVEQLRSIATFVSGVRVLDAEWGLDASNAERYCVSTPVNSFLSVRVGATDTSSIYITTHDCS